MSPLKGHIEDRLFRRDSIYAPVKSQHGLGNTNSINVTSSNQIANVFLELHKLLLDVAFGKKKKGLASEKKMDCYSVGKKLFKIERSLGDG